VMLSLTNGIDNSYPSWVGIDEVEIMNSNGSSSVPEIDAASGSGALALLTGAIALMTEQRNTRRNPRRAV
jgi:hypothetical protein